MGRERAHGLFYMLLQSEDDNPSEVGLNSVFSKISRTNISEKRVIENNFRFKPAPVSGRVTCMSMSSGHAAVVIDDNKSVSTWGHGEDGALGLEEHLISNFDPPSPTPVTSINSQVKEVCCGAEFTLMLTTEGQVYSCGSGTLGKLGHGDEIDRPLPTLVGTFEEKREITIESFTQEASLMKKDQFCLLSLLRSTESFQSVFHFYMLPLPYSKTLDVPLRYNNVSYFHIHDETITQTCDNVV